MSSQAVLVGAPSPARPTERSAADKVSPAIPVHTGYVARPRNLIAKCFAAWHAELRVVKPRRRGWCRPAIGLHNSTVKPVEGSSQA